MVWLYIHMGSQFFGFLSRLKDPQMCNSMSEPVLFQVLFMLQHILHCRQDIISLCQVTYTIHSHNQSLCQVIYTKVTPSGGVITPDDVSYCRERMPVFFCQCLRWKLLTKWQYLTTSKWNCVVRNATSKWDFCFQMGRTYVRYITLC